MKAHARGRLKQLAAAHGKRVKSSTPRMEDYLEIIYELIKEKGYATTVDISKYLHVKAPSVTYMTQKLHDDDFLVYEKYRGIRLTLKGEKVAKSIRERHGILAQFLKLLGIDDETAHRDAEGIEHHLNPKTLSRLASLVKFMIDNPDWLKPVREHLSSTEQQG